MAEGVRIYCQTTWRTVMGDQGRENVEAHLDAVVDFYVACTEADI